MLGHDVKEKQNIQLENKVICDMEIVSAKRKLSNSVSQWHYFTMIKVNKQDTFLK